MSGLIKPVTQRGRSIAARRTRNPAINVHAANGGGILYGRKDDSLFISSYAGDKQRKQKQQMIDRIKKLLIFGTIGIIFFFIGGSMSSDEKDEIAVQAANQLRAPTKEVAVSKPVTTPPEPAKPIVVLTMVDVAKTQPVPSEPITKNPEASSICGRKINIDLFDPSSWPTPQTQPTPTYPDTNNKGVLISGYADMFGGLGCQFNSFFHAYDYAAEKKQPIYMTKNNWALDNVIYPLFFGGSVGKHVKFWTALQDALGIKIVENERVLSTAGVTAEHKNQKSLYYTNSQKYDAKTLRNSRDTIFRNLFQYPSKDVCAIIDGNDFPMEDSDKYTVVHFSTPGIGGYLKQLNDRMGKDLSDANAMKPDYIKNILKQLDMLNQPILPIDTDSANADQAAHKLIGADPDLAKQIKYEKGHLNFINKTPGSTWNRSVASYIYLAVLADVYIGNPVDQLSLWIARMRYSLGIKNSYVLTEKKGDNWVSFIDDETYLVLYDSSKLATPWMA